MQKYMAGVGLLWFLVSGCWAVGTSVDWSQVPPETEGTVESQIDTFSGQHVVRLRFVPARGTHLISISAFTSDANLNEAYVSFTIQSHRGDLLDCDVVRILINGQSYTLSGGDYDCNDVDCSEVSCYIRETRSYSTPFRLVRAISEARSAQIQVCAQVGRLSPAAIRTFQLFVSERDKLMSSIHQDFHQINR